MSPARMAHRLKPNEIERRLKTGCSNAGLVLHCFPEENVSTRTTGAEFKAFYEDKTFWPGGTWHEDEEVTVDGTAVPEDFALSEVADEARLVLVGGYVTNEANDDLGSFEGYFRKWRKKQTTAFLAVEVSRDKAESVKAAIIAAGGKVKG